MSDINEVRERAEELASALEKLDAPQDATTIRALLAAHAGLQALVSDPWRGLYAPERMPKLTGMEYAAHHPDLPMWGDDREKSIVPLLTAQGFEAKGVTGDYPEDQGDVSAMLADWEPESPGDDWRLVAIYDTEDSDMAALFVRPLAMAVQP